MLNKNQIIEFGVICCVQVGLSPICPDWYRNQKGGKSGQHRAPYFLTGRGLIGDGQSTESAAENIPPQPLLEWGKGEKVG